MPGPELSPTKVCATGSSTRTNSAPAGDVTLKVKPGVVASNGEGGFWLGVVDGFWPGVPGGFGWGGVGGFGWGGVGGFGSGGVGGIGWGGVGGFGSGGVGGAGESTVKR